MKTKSFLSEIDIGATDELSLRVSVATLVRLLFEHPSDGKLMLALERKATLLDSENGPVVDVKSQPFGGAIQILDPGALQRQIGDFHFDSEESRAEQDFRIFIRPADWEEVRVFCLRQFDQPNDSSFGIGPNTGVGGRVCRCIEYRFEARSIYRSSNWGYSRRSPISHRKYPRERLSHSKNLSHFRSPHPGYWAGNRHDRE